MKKDNKSILDHSITDDIVQDTIKDPSAQENKIQKKYYVHRKRHKKKGNKDADLCCARIASNEMRES